MLYPKRGCMSRPPDGCALIHVRLDLDKVHGGRQGLYIFEDNVQVDIPRLWKLLFRLVGEFLIVLCFLFLFFCTLLWFRVEFVEPLFFFSSNPYVMIFLSPECVGKPPSGEHGSLL